MCGRCFVISALLLVLTTFALCSGCKKSDDDIIYLPPGKAANPSPADSAPSVPLTTNLTWGAASGADSYDVYIGTVQSEVQDATPSSAVFLANRTVTHADPGALTYGVTYYWRVDAKNFAGRTKGDVWSFTVENAPAGVPAKASGPNPEDKAVNVELDRTLLWSSATGATAYDVYFSTVESAVASATTGSPEYMSSPTVASYTHSVDFNYDTTYYWRIDSVNSFGTTTGDVWSFMTLRSATAYTIYVDNAGGDDANDGKSWAKAVETIQKGLDLAQNTCVVLVADGTYQGTGNRDLTFGGKSVYLKSVGGAANCTIDPENSGRGFVVISGETHNTVIDGFTIYRGQINGTVPPDGFGGGIVIVNSSVSIKNCVFDTCVAEMGGAGLMCAYGSVWVYDCVFKNGTAGGDGGGIGLAESTGLIMNCVFDTNIAEGGAGLMCSDSGSLTMHDCVFKNGTAVGGDGGGMTLSSSPNVMITDCVIYQNSANECGGGIACWGTGIIMRRCLIAENHSTEDGGGIAFGDEGTGIDMRNCTIAENTAAGSGGGFAGGDGDSIVLSLTNCIVWGNLCSAWGHQVNIYGSAIFTMSYCDYADNSLDPNNISTSGSAVVNENPGCLKTDPLFAASGGDEFYLGQVAAGQGADSPCVDAGSDTAANLGLDAKTTRTDSVTDSGQVDMGYHYDP